MSYFKTFNTTTDTNNASGDAFGRLRVSSPKTIFDSKQLHNNLPLLWDDQEVSGSGTTSTHSVFTASTTLGVGVNEAGRRVRQTFMRFNYQPGKSQQVLMTGVLTKSGGGGFIKRSFGFYDDDNGLFLVDDSGVISMVRRTNVTGTPVDNTVNQANWNIDPMDGTGLSGITLDFSKTQIFVIDFEWLGVGRVRLGFNVDGVTHYCHEFLNANNLTEVYMSTPNLPCRYEIENGGFGAASTMDHSCCSVMSEGGTDDLGVLHYASTEGTHLVATTEDTLYAVMGIRLRTEYIGTTVKLIKTGLQLQTVDDMFEWVLLLNPDVAGTFTYADHAVNSAVQIARGVTANTVTNGTAIGGGFGQSADKAAGGEKSDLDNAIVLGSSIAGVSDKLVLCVRPVGGSTSIQVEGGLGWRELL